MNKQELIKLHQQFGEIRVACDNLIDKLRVVRNTMENNPGHFLACNTGEWIDADDITVSIDEIGAIWEQFAETEKEPILFVKG